MAQHGYLRDYDEDYRGGEAREPERGFMFEDRNRERFRERDERFGPEHGYGGYQGDYGRSGREQGGFGGYGDWREGRTSFSSHPDEHYRSWRQKQIDAIDRDYEEYRREREQEFHRDFEAWRQQRHSNPQPVQPGMTQSGLSDTTGTLELTSPSPIQTSEGPDPMATATLGTTSTGRGRR